MLGRASPLRVLLTRWRSYRYRFVPWIALNLARKRRTTRHVAEDSKDKIISDPAVLGILLKIFQALIISNFRDDLVLLPEAIRSKYKELCTIHRTAGNGLKQSPCTPGRILFDTLGFSINRGPSSLISAGMGVFVSKGSVPKGAVVAMYPGTVYQKYEPIFFQSIGNPFVFRCIDGILIDGNDKGISRAVYRSCSRRDQLGPFKMSDITWLTSLPQNPLAVGQYVNNCSNDREPNVCYQEFDVLEDFPLELRQYLPNVNYSHDIEGPLRCVVLVALRDIKEEEGHKNSPTGSPEEVALLGLMAG
ncbi:SET domain-containing protein 9 isoform X2 [Rhinatrema bivittatum]|uniref:SET domain-containing protein 9 isoform X2 n=1 Tax=Rhinatrema bivittatum TaxID=194408 RepID=UPI0011274743|nr:SET domain-containing protein 9 isoform X2 [Rhinatrema bivittatum]